MVMKLSGLAVSTNDETCIIEEDTANISLEDNVMEDVPQVAKTEYVNPEVGKKLCFQIQRFL